MSDASENHEWSQVAVRSRGGEAPKEAWPMPRSTSGTFVCMPWWAFFIFFSRSRISSGQLQARLPMGNQQKTGKRWPWPLWPVVANSSHRCCLTRLWIVWRRVSRSRGNAWTLEFKFNFSWKFSTTMFSFMRCNGMTFSVVCVSIFQGRKHKHNSWDGWRSCRPCWKRDGKSWGGIVIILKEVCERLNISGRRREAADRAALHQQSAAHATQTRRRELQLVSGPEALVRRCTSPLTNPFQSLVTCVHCTLTRLVSCDLSGDASKLIIKQEISDFRQFWWCDLS